MRHHRHCELAQEQVVQLEAIPHAHCRSFRGTSLRELSVDNVPLPCKLHQGNSGHVLPGHLDEIGIVELVRSVRLFPHNFAAPVLHRWVQCAHVETASHMWQLPEAGNNLRNKRCAFGQQSISREPLVVNLLRCIWLDAKVQSIGRLGGVAIDIVEMPRALLHIDACMA